MTIRPIDVGEEPNDETGDTLRDGGIIINENFAELDSRTSDAANKLATVQAGATKNRPDAELLARANHTGTQLASTISDLAQAVRGTLLEGLTLSNSTAVAADTILAALGKLQGQVNNRVKVGDFGVGSADLAPDISANSVSVTRFYRTFNDANSANLGLTAGIHLQRDADRSGEIVLSWGDESAYFRVSNSMGARAPWRKLVKVGDYGVGATEAVDITNADTVSASGTYRIRDTTPGGPGFWGTLYHSSHDSVSFTQLAVSISDGSVWTRRKLSGSTIPWTRQTPEFISNANGSAIKFPDGTMIAYAEGSLTTATSPVGNLFSSQHQAFTFPVAFAARPTVTPTTTDREGVDNIPFLGGVNNTNTYIGFYSPTNTGKCKPAYVAIGRWK